MQRAAILGIVACHSVFGSRDLAEMHHGRSIDVDRCLKVLLGEYRYQTGAVQNSKAFRQSQKVLGDLILKSHSHPSDIWVSFPAVELQNRDRSWCREGNCRHQAQTADKKQCDCALGIRTSLEITCHLEPPSESHR